MENMSYEFKEIAALDVAEEVSESANVLVEDGGVIKRAPKNQIVCKTENEAPNIYIIPNEYIFNEEISKMMDCLLSGGQVYGYSATEYQHNDYHTLEPVKIGVLEYDNMGNIEYWVYFTYGEHDQTGYISKEQYEKYMNMIGI